eukprot:364855-Chlamydomonas_euryale.AAC.4
MARNAGGHLMLRGRQPGYGGHGQSWVASHVRSLHHTASPPSAASSLIWFLCTKGLGLKKDLSTSRCRTNVERMSGSGTATKGKFGLLKMRYEKRAVLVVQPHVLHVAF